MNRCGYRQASGPDGHLAHLRDFKTNTMEGLHGRGVWRGWLPAHVKDEYFSEEVVYTVMSYNTPIGWVTASGSVVVPNVHYSVTTSKHQGYVRAWLGRAGTVVEHGYPAEVLRQVDLDRTSL